jgi:hypothetical protein
VPINLIQADGSSRPVVVQSTRASVLLNGKEIPTNLMTIPGSPEAKTLLGVDFLKEAGLVIDYKDDNSRSSATPSDEEVTRICTTMSTLSPLISPFGSPLITMECDYESNLTENYGPCFAPNPHVIASRNLQILPILDTDSRSEFMWFDASQGVEALWNEMACEDFPNVHIASLDFQELTGS